MPAGRVQRALGLHARRNCYNPGRRDEQAADQRAGNLKTLVDLKKIIIIEGMNI